MSLVYLGIGSNIGDRAANLQAAIDLLPEAGLVPLRISSVYETNPMYMDDQPLFLNVVVEGESRFLPRTLLKKLQQIESKLGRKRTMKNGPRPIDIDVLFYGRYVIETPELIVPHPRLHERRFVLEPLCELMPQLRHPITRRTAWELMSTLPPGGVTRTDLNLQTPT